MWPFNKKENLAVPRPRDSSEIELIPEDIPDDLPSLEIESNPVSTPVKREGPLFPEIPQQIIRSKPVKMPSVDRFVTTQTNNNIASEINEVMIGFDNMEFEINRVVNLNEQRNEKIDNLQNTVEDIGKKLISIDNTLFGG